MLGPSRVPGRRCTPSETPSAPHEGGCEMLSVRQRGPRPPSEPAAGGHRRVRLCVKGPGAARLLTVSSEFSGEFLFVVLIHT